MCYNVYICSSLVLAYCNRSACVDCFSTFFFFCAVAAAASLLILFPQLEEKKNQNCFSVLCLSSLRQLNFIEIQTLSLCVCVQCVHFLFICKCKWTYTIRFSVYNRNLVDVFCIFYCMELLDESIWCVQTQSDNNVFVTKKS